MGSFYVSGKLPTYPSTKPTSTLSSYLGQNVGLGKRRGRAKVSQKRKMIPGMYEIGKEKDARVVLSGSYYVGDYHELSVICGK